MMKILFLLGLILLPSCALNRNALLSKPGGIVFSYMPKTDNKVYQHGWIDGCTTGMGTFTKEFAKQFYPFTKDMRFYEDGDQYFDGKLITPKDRKVYDNAWGIANSACRHYILGSYRSGFEGYGNSMPTNAGSGDKRKVGQLDTIQQVYEIEAWGPVGIGGL